MTELPQVPPGPPAKPTALLAWLPWSALAVLPPAALLTWLWTAPAAEQHATIARCLYWFAAGIVAIALGVSVWRVRCRSQPLAVWLRRHAPAAICAGAAMCVVVWVSPPQMRVQFDETSLVGVSQCMHQQRMAVMTTAALPFHGAPLPLEQMVDKRPPLFAFLVSLLHDVFGYTPDNALRLNVALLGVALFLAAAAMRRFGLLAALTTQLLLLAVPLVSVVATSAGFELLATVLFGLLVLAASDVIARPEPVRWCMFLTTGVLFAWSRYESVAAFGCVLLLVVWGTRGRNRPATASRLAFAAVPFLVAPLLVLLAHARNPNFYPEAGGEPLVSLRHGLEHAPAFVAAFFAPWLGHALPGPLAIVGAGLGLLWLWRRRPVPYTALLVLVPVAGVTALALFWFYGDAREPTALRLYLPVAVLAGCSPMLLLPLAGPRATVPLFVVAVGLAAFRLYELRIGDAFPQLRRTAMTEQFYALVARHDDGSGRTLWISGLPQPLCIRGHAGLSVASFVRRRQDIDRLRLQGDINKLFLIATPFDRDLAPAFGDPKQLIDAFDHQLVEKVDGGSPFTLYRLQL